MAKRQKRQSGLFDDVPLFDPSRVEVAPKDAAPTPAVQSAPATQTGKGIIGGKGGELSANGSREQPLTVGQLSAGISEILETCLSRVWVVGEVSGLKRAGSGHLYFDLKDGEAVISCVMWRSDAGRLRLELEDGLEVVASGRVGYYPRSGRLQLYVTALELRGAGLLELRFRQMKERLEKEGLFGADRKRRLPQFPMTIGIVTSGTGAALRDILHVLGRRWPAVRVVVAPVRVQGEGAKEEISAAIRAFDRHLRDEVEVLIIGRGGGSLEDLWAFNEECVARAIASCAIPVVSAVGHETDFSISDFVADVRAATPSAAAEMVVPDRHEYARKTGADASRLERAIDRRLQELRNRLERVAEHRFFRYPQEIAGRWGMRLDEFHQRLTAAAGGRLAIDRERVGELERRLLNRRPSRQLALRMTALERAAGRHAALGERLLERAGSRVDRLADRLGALSPLAVLGRGYSITLHGATGRAVRRASDVEAGVEVKTLLGGGDSIRSKVTGSKRGDEEINGEGKKG